MAVRQRILALGAVLLAGNVAVWLLLGTLARGYPFLLSLGILAYVFGLRHAADADHIAAIDNTTRKLMQDGQRPLGVGFFFSLGHSTIVFLLATALVLATRAVAGHIPFLEHVGGIVGTLISAIFLYAIAVLNLVILRGIYDVFRRLHQARKAGETPQAELDRLLEQRGLMNRLLGRFYRSIRRSYQMYPVGVLFGLGFDTASEVALLGISAFAASHHMPAVYALVLPALFTAGMALVDTADGVMMQYAYGWAFLKPIRKVYYNLTITAVSVVVALVIGTIESLQVLAMEFSLRGGFWTAIEHLRFSDLGYVIIGILLTGWLLAVAVYRMRGYERGFRTEDA